MKNEICIDITYVQGLYEENYQTLLKEIKRKGRGQAKERHKVDGWHRKNHGRNSFRKIILENFFYRSLIPTGT